MPACVMFGLKTFLCKSTPFFSFFSSNQNISLFFSLSSGRVGAAKQISSSFHYLVNALDFFPSSFSCFSHLQGGIFTGFGTKKAREKERKRGEMLKNLNRNPTIRYSVIQSIKDENIIKKLRKNL